MASAPRLRGIPFNTETATDSSGFAPIYDPQAIRFARKVNFTIGTVLALGALSLTYLLFTSEPLVAFNRTRDSSDFGNTISSLLLNFVLPIVLCTVGFLTIRLLTPRIGFDLPRAYRATADALREWLPSTVGDFPAEKESFAEDLKETFATPRDSARFILDADSESYLHRAAQDIARLSPESLELYSKDEQMSFLQLDSTGRYQLTV